MLKILLSITLLVGFITACSDRSQQVNPQVEKAATSQLVEFGIVKSTDSAKLLSASIYNDTGATLTGPATISNSSFSFISGFNCSAGAKNKTSCSTIKISFTPQGKDPGEYNATLNLGTISVPIHATIEAPAVPSEAELAALITSSLGDNVDFGTMLYSGSAVLKTISLTNGTGQSLSLPVLSTNIGPFVLSYDSCSNKAIAKGSSCLIKVSFSPTGRSGDQSGSISYSGHIINFSASVVTPESVAQSGTPAVVGGVSYAPNLQFLIGSSVVTDYSFSSGVKTVTVSLKNNGNLSSIVSNLVMTGSPNYSLMSNTCLNKSLAPGATCSVKVLGSNALPNSSISLAFADKTLSLTMSSNEVVQRQLVINKSSPQITIQTGKNICGPTCNQLIENYNDGETASLSVSSSTEKVAFTGWTGDCSGTGNCSLVMNGNKSVSLTTENRHYLVSLNKTGVVLVYGDQLNGPNPYIPAYSYVNNKPEYDIVYAYLIKEGTKFRTYHSPSADYVFKWGGVQSSCGYNDFCEFTVNQDFENYVQYFKKVENCANPPQHATVYQKQYSIPADGYLACEVKECASGFQVSNGACVPKEPTLSLIANFSYSDGSSAPAACKVKGPFGQDQLMADLVVDGPFSTEEKDAIQTATCNYLQQNSGGVSGYDFTQMNQCSINDFGLYLQVGAEAGIPYFLLMNNLYFDFSPYNVVPLEGPFDCEMYLSMGMPMFEMTNGGINLTDGVMNFPVEYRNSIYYGIKGPNAAFYYLAKSNKINSVSIISMDYKVALDTRSPLIPFDGKLFFVGKFQEETQWKLFYLDENDTIHEFAGQIPGYQYLGVRDNNALRITASSNYLLVNREIDRNHILKISSFNGPVVDISNPNIFVMDLLVGAQGEFVGDSYYPTAYYDNNGLSFLKKIDLVNNTISNFEDLSYAPLYQQKSNYGLAKTNQGTKLWFFIYDPSASSVLEYDTISGTRTLHPIQGSGVNSRTFSPNVTYFSSSGGANYYVYKISDNGLQLVDTRFGIDVSVGFIANDGSLVYVETNLGDVYKINYNQPKVKVFDNKVFYQSQYAYMNQNLRDYFSNPVYDNQIIVAMADVNPSTNNVESNFKITFIDLDTLQITKQYSICPAEVGSYDFRSEPSAVRVGSDGLYLSVRTCGTSDYQLYKYSK